MPAVAPVINAVVMEARYPAVAQPGSAPDGRLPAPPGFERLARGQYARQQIRLW